MGSVQVRDDALGVAFELDERFADAGFPRDEERRWLLALELMVQPPERWEQERDALELPFRTLELL